MRVEEHDPEPMLEVPELNPATDRIAFACAWFGLGAGIGILCAAFVLAQRF
jgi:hypothetical protein